MKISRVIKRIPSWLLVLIITSVGAIFRFIDISKSSIWHDEGFSIMLSSRSPYDIWVGSARDVHPPLYYTLLHVWTSIFGSSVVAIRGLSAIAGIAIIPVGYLVIKRISGKRAALLGALLLALAPFLVRYSQEARMYGLLGLEMAVALYSVVRISETPNKKWPYLVYVLSVTAGLYTHYFAALAVISFWFYFIVLESPKKWKFNKTIFLSIKWWIANIFALVLLLPWIPNMCSQIRRGQGLGWLPKSTIHTFNDTFWQFITFTDARQVWIIFYWLIPIAFLVATAYLIIKDKSEQKYITLLASFSLIPILFALIISAQKPIFHERYFAFAATGIFMLIAIFIDRISSKNIWLFSTLSLIIITTELVGIRNVYGQSNHQMEKVMSHINNYPVQGTPIVAGELYVYFDGSFYSHSTQSLELYTGQGRPNGYGESGLIYDKNVYLDSYNLVQPGTKLWLLGKTGSHTYYDKVPSSWTLIDEYTSGYIEARLYQVN